MIPQKPLNKARKAYSAILKNESYIIVNIIFAGVILLIFAYSGIFSPVNDNYPVACIHEKLTGESCISCGLSHGFSLILRGKTEEALYWNVYSLQVFLFFALQLILRVAFSLFYLSSAGARRQLIIMDCIGSGLIFLIAFHPYLKWIFQNIF